jgi:hypothetical protein
MGIISYKIRNDNFDPSLLPDDHFMNRDFAQANQAWAFLRKHFGMSNDDLRKRGYKVKLNVDESEVLEEVAEIAVDQAPVPGIFKRLLGGLFKRKG